MNKVMYNSDNLIDAKKYLSQSLTDFDSAINIANSLDVLNFSYSKWLSGLPELLRKRRSEIVDVNEWITSCVNKINDFSVQSINEIDGLEVHSGFIKSLQINRIS